MRANCVGLDVFSPRMYFDVTVQVSEYMAPTIPWCPIGCGPGGGLGRGPGYRFYVPTASGDVSFGITFVWIMTCVWIIATLSITCRAITCESSDQFLGRIFCAMKCLRRLQK